MPQTAIEKIVNAHARGLRVDRRVHAGDFVTIRPRHVMTEGGTGAVIDRFHAIAGEDGRVLDPQQPVIATGRDGGRAGPESPGEQERIIAFAARHGVDIYPPGRGAAHRVMIEEGYVTPGSLCVGCGPHTNICGAIAACGDPVGLIDAAAIWATGETWWRIPEQVRVVLEGGLPEGASGRDVIDALRGRFNDGEVRGCCVEFAGEGVGGLSVEERMVVADGTAGWGALAGLFPFDEALRDWLLDRADHFATRALPENGRVPYIRNDIEHLWGTRDHFTSDDGAFFSRTLTLDLSTVLPDGAGPAADGGPLGVTVEAHERPARKPAGQRIAEGFPGSVKGRTIFVSTDDANLDEALLENAGEGDIIVGGRNLDDGASPERTVRALAARGVRLVITASARPIFMRNAFNNGLIVIECPGLAGQLAEMHRADAGRGATPIPGPAVLVDFRASTVTCDGRSHAFGPLNETAQRLIAAGGIEALVRQRLSS